MECISSNIDSRIGNIAVLLWLSSAYLSVCINSIDYKNVSKFSLNGFIYILLSNDDKNVIINA